MEYCILAAGEGSRLAREGVAEPKPLVNLCGEPMVGRLIVQLAECDAEAISVLLNRDMAEAAAYLKQLAKRLPVPLRVRTVSTPSSLHTFYELRKLITSHRFVVTTVDTVFRTEDFRRYVRAFVSRGAVDAFMAVTAYVDDEKPLYVEVDSNMRVTGFSDTAAAEPVFVSGSIYGLTAPVFRVAKECLDAGVSRMRNFQRALVETGMNVEAWDFGKVMDVDHRDDIALAEQFIQGR